MHATLVGIPIVAVHPVAVNVAYLAIVVTRRKGCYASFLVKLDKLRTYERHNFGICVI